MASGLGMSLRSLGKSCAASSCIFCFDFGEVFRSEGFVAEKFVEKAGVDGRTDAELYVGKELHHRGGEQMRCGMAKDVERVGIFFGEDLQLDVVIERAAQIDQLAISGRPRWAEARHWLR